MFKPIQKEIKMFTHRLFNLFVAVALVAVIALTTQAAFSQMNSTYRESKEQAQREYKLGERYGEIPARVAEFSAEQIRREYILGERYGVTPQGYAREQTLREYWLGERYGQTP
jgi:type II secretory pathway component PulJ